MRVLHFYKTYRPDSQGGVEQLIEQLCSGCAARGVTSNVLTVSKNTVTVDFNDHFHYRTPQSFEISSSSFSLSAFRDFKKYAGEANIIHYHFPWPFMDMVHFASNLKKPTVVTYHSDIVKQKNLLRLYRPMMNRFLSSVDRIVATSPNYVETSSVLAAYRDKVSIIPIGLDPKKYPIPSPKLLSSWRARIGPRFFLFVGNLRYYKGLHYLLSALPNLDIPIVIIGAGHEESALKAQMNSLKLKNVHFVGAVDDTEKMALLYLSEAMLFPSHLRSEAFGISLLEAAMLGKPMLSCEIGTGTSYVNVHGDTGLVVPPGDPGSLRSAMLWLWQNPEQAQDMGLRAQKRFQEKFTADEMIKSYLAVYQQVLNR